LQVVLSNTSWFWTHYCNKNKNIYNIRPNSVKFLSINFQHESSAVTRCQIFRLKYTKFDFSCGCAPDLTGESSSWLGGDWLPPSPRPHIQFRLGLRPKSPQTPLGSPLAGWVGAGCPLSKTTHSISAGAAPQTSLGSPLAGWVGAGCPSPRTRNPRSRPFGSQYSFFPDPTILAP